MEISLENLYVDIGGYWVNYYTFTVSYCFKNTVKPRIKDSRLIWTTHHYGQFALFLGKRLAHTFFSKVNPLNTDTRTPLYKHFLCPP